MEHARQGAYAMHKAAIPGTPPARPSLLCSAEEVANRLIEAAQTSRRLPPVRVQGYFNAWPVLARSHWEAFAAEPPVLRPSPPSPRDVERMLEVMRWVQWLEVEQRHLVWMRAQHYGWREIGIRFACDRSTAWRHWQQALHSMADQLNQGKKLR